MLILSLWALIATNDFSCRMGLSSLALRHPELYRSALKLMKRAVEEPRVDLTESVEFFLADLDSQLSEQPELILTSKRRSMLLRDAGDNSKMISHLGEISVALQVNDLVQTSLSSDHVYPEKAQPGFDPVAFRKMFPYWLGEVDLNFKGGTAYGEVKTYQGRFKLSSVLKSQAALYRYLLEGRARQGTPVEVYYFFPLAAPRPSDIRWLEDQGFRVVIDQAP